jgi:dipeptidyl aminopeptidase/acylaminoacyl peptidase
MKKVSIWSEGTRMAGDLYYPTDWKDGERRPGIVLCHGWGQSKDWGEDKPFQKHAAAFAANGWVALAFDYRGWGESSSRVIVKEELPAERTEVTARVQVIRQVVDPYEWAWDLRHALDFLEGEPGVDPARLGIWGTSFAGGVVSWVVANDDRVKCAVSQVGLQDWRNRDDVAESTRDEAARQARGDADPIPQTPGYPAMPGTPNLAKMRDWSAIDHSERIKVPLLLIDAEDEPLFDRHANSELLYRRIRDAGKAPVEYRILKGARHGDAYFARWQECSDLAIGWFRQHL